MNVIANTITGQVREITDENIRYRAYENGQWVEYKSMSLEDAEKIEERYKNK